MAVNPVGGGYLNSASLQARPFTFLWDQGTRTNLYSFRLKSFSRLLVLWKENSVVGRIELDELEMENSVERA